MISLSGPAGAASFKYDALGRRIEKTVNGQSTGFLYDGAQAIAELKGSSLDTVYHTGIQIDEVLARYGSAGDRTLLTDALMSVIAQANDDQSTANFYAYSPYGETVTLGPDSQNSLQYTGRENDGTGLYYYRARYYDPVLKRFVSEDPMGIAGGFNLAAYVGGDPVSFNDPTGTIAGTVLTAAGVVLAGVVAYQVVQGAMRFFLGTPAICTATKRRIEYAEAAYNACLRRQRQGQGCQCDRELDELQRATDDDRRSCVGGATSSAAATQGGQSRVPRMATR